MQFINKNSKIFATCSAIASQDADNEIHVAENDIEDLMFYKDIDANIIHFYMKRLEQKGGMKTYSSTVRYE